MRLPKLIREALAKGPLAFKKLHEAIGGDDAKLARALGNMKYKGEVKIGDDDDKTIKLLGRKDAPPQGRRSSSGKKPAGKRGKKGKKLTIRKIADRMQRTPQAEQFRDIVLDNLIGAGALLRQAVEDGVDGLDQNFSIMRMVRALG